MKEAIIVDTGYWIALFDSRDTNHAVAKRNSKILLQSYRLYLTDFDDHYKQMGYTCVLE